jgi:hypothetical protein
MKFLGYNIMAISFLAFSGWIAYVGGQWGWPAVAAFILSVVPSAEQPIKENKSQLTEDERSLIDELKKSFKNENDKK